MKIFNYPDNLNLRLPMVSIVVTNYNYSDYIVSCLDSISAQSYTNWECIIVDDCSEDNSVQRIKQYIDSKNDSGQRFKFICTEDNGGQMNAIKLGTEMARGEFFVSVDVDDMLYSNFLERHLLFHLNSGTPLAFTCSNHIQIDERNNILAGTFNYHLDLKENKFIHPSELFGDWIWSAMSCAMFRKPLIDLILPDKTEYFKVCADFYLFHFASILGNSLIMPEFLGCYRRHCKNNFSFNKIVSGSANPGDITNEPAKELVREVMLYQIQARYSYFYNYYCVQGIQRLVHLISTKSLNIQILRKKYSKLFEHLGGLPRDIEQDKDLLMKMYYSVPGRLMLHYIRILVKIKERFLSLFKQGNRQQLPERGLAGIRSILKA